MAPRTRSQLSNDSDLQHQQFRLLDVVHVTGAVRHIGKVKDLWRVNLLWGGKGGRDGRTMMLMKRFHSTLHQTESIQTAILHHCQISQTHLNLGCDEERGDAQQLQALLPHVVLGQHVAVEEVLGQVGGLPVEAVHLAHLQQRDG